MAVIGLIMLVSLLAIVAVLPVGIMLIVRSGKGRRPHPACGKCGYDLTGFAGTSEVCPECGVKLIEGGILPAQPQRHKGMLRWGIVMLVLPVLVIGLFAVVGITITNRAVVAQQQARRQAQIAALSQQRAVLSAELETLAAQLSSTTDDAVVAEIEQTITALEQKLAETEETLQSTRGGQ